MVKLNLNRIAELEKQNVGNNIYLNTLQQMVDIVMMPRDPMGLDNQSTTNLALNTLKDLGIIDMQNTTQQLNS